MRVLVVGEEEREAARKLAEFAAKPENHYSPRKDTWLPGDDPRFVLYLTDYRCVFSYTKLKGLYRHLSVSIRGSRALPAPAAMQAIVKLFGFEGGWPGDWEMAPHANECCVVAIQEIKEARHDGKDSKTQN
jgi:hypothetical protein